MMLRVPRRCEQQWMRVKEALRAKLAPGGQEIGDTEIHSSAFALLEKVLKTEPGLDTDWASNPILPFLPPDDDPVFDNLPGRRPVSADLALGGKIAELGEKIDALADALVDQKD